MERPDKSKIDALVIVARAAFGERGRRSPVQIIVTLAILLALLALLVWWLWPRLRLPQLLVAVYDQVARPEEPVVLCAQVEPVQDEGEPLDLSGCELYFQDVRSQKLLAHVPTGRDGEARTEQSFPAGAERVQVLVRYSGEKQGLHGAEANGRVFVWPAGTPLLVVDADEGPADVEAARFWGLNNLDIRPRPGAASALGKLKARYHIVYLSAAADRPSRYNKLRAWLGMRGHEPFPDGPVLARVCGRAEPDAAAFRRAVLPELTGQFPGPAVGVTAAAETARAFHAAGLRTFLLGGSGEVPEGVTRIKSWEAWSQALP